jgi:hypothetical protein
MAIIYTRATKGSALTWTEGDANITNLNTAKIENVVEDTTPQLGGNLDVNGQKIVSTSNGNIALEPNGTGKVTANKNIETTADVKGFEVWSTCSIADEGGQINLAIPSSGTSLTGQVTIDVYQNKLRFFQGDSAKGAYIDLTAAAAGVATNLLSGGGVTVSDDTSTNATRYIVFEDATSGTVSTVNVSSTKLTFNPSTGRLSATSANIPTIVCEMLQFKNPIEEIYNIGTSGGTIAPNPANGSVQQITLNSALTINGFTSATAGESVTLIIYGGTAYTSITSTMKFAGGLKTLTGTAGCIDILTIYFDGTTYFASLAKGFA